MKPAGAALVGELNEDMAGNIGRGLRESNPTAKSSRAEAAVGKRKKPRGGGLSLALDGSFEVRAQGRRLSVPDPCSVHDRSRVQR